MESTPPENATIADGSGDTPTVELVMSSRLSYALPQETVDELRLRMKEERLRHLLVCDRQGKLVANIEGNEFTARQLGDLVDTVLRRPAPSPSR